MARVRGEDKPKEGVALTVGSNTSLLGTQLQAKCGQNLLNKSQRPFSLRFGLADDEEVVSVTNKVKTVFVQGPIHVIKDDVSEQGRNYASNNVANTVVEFSVSIPREELRPGYGHGFLGAPLTENSPDRPTQQDRGEGCDKSTNRRSRRPGGHNGV